MSVNRRQTWCDPVIPRFVMSIAHLISVAPSLIVNEQEPRSSSSSYTDVTSSSSSNPTRKSTMRLARNPKRDGCACPRAMRAVASRRSARVWLHMLAKTRSRTCCRTRPTRKTSRNSVFGSLLPLSQFRPRSSPCAPSTWYICPSTHGSSYVMWWADTRHFLA